MENIGIGELGSNPVADQCLKCFALYIKSISLLFLNRYNFKRLAINSLVCVVSGTRISHRIHKTWLSYNNQYSKFVEQNFQNKS